MEGRFYFEIDKIVILVINLFCWVFFVFKEKLKFELDCFWELVRIWKVKEFINWVLSFVVIEKFNGKLRICIDFVYLNKVLKWLYYLLFVIEDVFFELVDVKVFSKVDFNDGFLYIEFDNELFLLFIF